MVFEWNSRKNDGLLIITQHNARLLQRHVYHPISKVSHKAVPASFFQDARERESACVYVSQTHRSWGANKNTTTRQFPQKADRVHVCFASIFLLVVRVLKGMNASRGEHSSSSSLLGIVVGHCSNIHLNIPYGPCCQVCVSITPSGSSRAGLQEWSRIH